MRDRESEEPLRVWLCECGNVHLETRHFRLTFTPEEFIGRLRSAVRQNRRSARPVTLTRQREPIVRISCPALATADSFR
jgi:hypothetical protein